MSKTIIAVIIVIIVLGLGYWVYQSSSAPEGMTEAEAKNCENDSDCFVFGEDGDCNCGCFNKNFQWEKQGDCFCAVPKSCKCPNGKCEDVFEETLNQEIAYNLVVEKWGDCAPDECESLAVNVLESEDDISYVEVIHDGLRDDSVRASRKVIQVDYIDNAWVLGEVLLQEHKCQPGRGHQDFSEELCF